MMIARSGRWAYPARVDFKDGGATLPDPEAFLVHAFLE